MKLVAATLLALACCSANGHGDPKPASGSDPHPPPPAAPPKAPMDITYRDMPDERWKHAGEIAIAAARDLLAQTGSAHVVVRPYASPDGAILPYLLLVETTGADGAPALRSTAAVWNDKLANGGGPATATAVLAAAGFPARHLALGHLLELFYITGAVDLSWYRPPSAAGWDAVTRPFLGTDLAPAIDYAAGGAVVHLYRGAGAGSGAPPPPGPGFETPVVERLDLAFDARAHFARTILRQNPARTGWVPVP